MKTLRIINVRFLDNNSVACGQLVDPETQEVIDDIMTTNVHMVEMLLHADSETFEKLTTIENCEVVECNVEGRKYKRVIPYYVDDNSKTALPVYPEAPVDVYMYNKYFFEQLK